MIPIIRSDGHLSSLKHILTAFVVVGTAFLIMPTAVGAMGRAESMSTDANLKVAFIGDSGQWEGFQSVLSLIKAEGADVVMHQGDFDYVEDASGFFGHIDTILGSDFPYFMSVGNHDVANWDAGCISFNGCYAEYLLERMARIGAVPDDFNLNDQMYSVSYRGLNMVFVGQANGLGDSVYTPYLRSQLESSENVWNICSWHKNQNAMQVGGKSNEMGWGVYETCREFGAIIATAHEHSYERTRTLVSMQGQAVNPDWPEVDRLLVDAGSTFSFVSGLGGLSIRNQDRCLPATFPYGCNGEWANVYTTDQGAQFGALFITFNVDGDPNHARGYFKNISSEVIDEFEIFAGEPDVPDPPTPGPDDRPRPEPPMPNPGDIPALPPVAGGCEVTENLPENPDEAANPAASGTANPKANDNANDEALANANANSVLNDGRCG